MQTKILTAIAIVLLIAAICATAALDSSLDYRECVMVKQHLECKR